MNKVVLIGRLTRDPDIRYSSGAEPMAIARYTLAVNRRFKREGQVDADFINIVAFGKAGSFAEKYLSKGMQIAVSGRIQTGSYEKDGRKIYTTDIIVEEQEFTEKKRESNESSSKGNVTDSGFVPVDVEDDDLPF